MTAPGTRIAGPALTVACPFVDNRGILAAVDRARRGEVLVVDLHAEAAMFARTEAGASTLDFAGLRGFMPGAWWAPAQPHGRGRTWISD